jgi:hypothetical protein
MLIYFVTLARVCCRDQHALVAVPGKPDTASAGVMQSFFNGSSLENGEHITWESDETEKGHAMDTRRTA